MEIIKYENAEKYLRDVLQEHLDTHKLPPKSKRSEKLKTKTAERQSLAHEYNALKKEVDDVYKIQRSARDILDSEGCKPHIERISLAG